MAKKKKGEVSFWWGFTSPIRLTNTEVKERKAKREGTSKVGGKRVFRYVQSHLFKD